MSKSHSVIAHSNYLWRPRQGRDRPITELNLISERLKSNLKSVFRVLSATCRAIGWRRFESRDGFYSRERFVAEVANAGDVLEIGPFDRPLVSGARIKYFDVMDQHELMLRAERLGHDPAGCPRIDYVSQHADLRVIKDRQFDAVVSSHSIEHQPDLIQHLEDVFELLRPNGRYYLIIPDRRFTFDHYLPDTRASDLLAASLERRRKHTLASVLAHYADTTHNAPMRHWIGLHRPERRPLSSAAELRAGLDRVRAANGAYVDVHAWCFSPQSFKIAITTLIELGSLRFRIERIYGTPFGSGEFFAILRRPSDDPLLGRKG